MVISSSCKCHRSHSPLLCLPPPPDDNPARSRQAADEGGEGGGFGNGSNRHVVQAEEPRRDLGRLRPRHLELDGVYVPRRGLQPTKRLLQASVSDPIVREVIGDRLPLIRLYIVIATSVPKGVLKYAPKKGSVYRRPRVSVRSERRFLQPYISIAPGVHHYICPGVR